MASQRDIEIASLLFRSGILPQEEIQAALGRQGRLLTEGTVKTLAEVLVEMRLLDAEVASTFTDAPLETVQPFPDYRLEERIGDGASARVYRGVYLPRELPVAVKVLHPEQALQDKPLRRFLREAKLLCKMRHDNIVRGYECRKIAGFRFLSMEYVLGGTILERIDKRGPMDGAAALHVSRQIARALSYLYANGIVHRDIKPGNMLVDDLWHVKLIDLGLCRIAGQAEESAGTTVGTVGYISPEQAKGVSDLDIRSDIYSLGVTLYHMVAGEVPFAGENDLEVMTKQIMQSLRSDRLKSLNISPHVHYAIEKMMAKDREIRFQHPDDIVKELDAYLDSVKYQPIPIARPVAGDQPAPARHPLAPKGKQSADIKPTTPISRRRRWR
ncbi:MAG: serine/threonine-protein kinase [Planctomycetota bacterium]